MQTFDPNRTDYIEQLNAMADAVAGLVAGAFLPRQQCFSVGIDGQNGAEFVLDAAPLNDVVIISIDGYTVHRYTVAANIVRPAVVALPGEEVMVTYWA